MKTLILALIATSFCTPVWANIAQGNPASLGQVQLLGAATQTCQSYAQMINSGDPSMQLAFFSWAQGYASAASAITGKQIFANAQASLSFIQNNVGAECMSNPAQSYGAAVDLALQKHLQAQVGQ
jgi:hypothetical protein